VFYLGYRVGGIVRGDFPGQSACLSLVEGLPLLEVFPEVVDIAEVYQVRKLMPKAPVRDALHLALASFYQMDYLLTWNCQHIANVNKARHLEVLNTKMGLHVPRLVTPHLPRPMEDLG